MQRKASIDDQIRTCRDYAARQGFEVVETYSDSAISGASMMRGGIQKLMRHAQSCRFDVVVAEGLDRLSRNQADIAGIFQNLRFLNISIWTIRENEVNDIYVGLVGAMNARAIQDISQKTRRGLHGRAKLGKSAGGLTYGYRSVIKYNDDGEQIRGDRVIDENHAKIVRRIYQDYAKGISPKKIAEQLNNEDIPGPSGAHWNTSTIHGNRDRGTGIINNELYIGRQIWNRLTYVKNPQTGKRVSRLNPEEQWVIANVPELRIIDEDLWEAVRARQGKQKVKNTQTQVWDRRRPKFLFSGLMECSCCGSGFSKISQHYFGCSAARKKGPAVCTNMRSIKREDLDDRVLTALANNLMDPEVVQIFYEEYAAERNRLMAEANAGRTELEKELRRVTGDHKKLVDAIIAGVPAEQVKDRMIELDGRRKEIEKLLATAAAPDKLRIHPSMAKTYRDRVGQLIRGLTDAEDMEEAKEALRALVDKIVLTPDPDGDGLLIDLHGALASLLRLATGQPLQQVMRRANSNAAPGASGGGVDKIGELVLVAGVGFEPTTFRL
ncbi:recombinase family protein [Paracoccus isoporae]|uniref:recombinase family protein n=1 Tax=Paracoccus isoporae TaxID=591205 RepID=UPI001FDFE556|nr:recombinase family protein [Paracoccus isoporae]